MKKWIILIIIAVAAISTRRSGAKQAISALRPLTASQVEPVTGLALP